MPWPVRWVLAAIVLGFCAAIALWAFEFGKALAGLDAGAREELAKLREEVVRLRDARDKAQSVANTSGSLLTTEKSVQERLVVQLRQLEIENRALRDDLGFFERLLPAGGGEGLAIRGLQAEMLANAQIKWQVLVIQSVKNAPEFNGKIELTVTGLQNGRPWSMTLPGGPQALQMRQYRRIEGVFDLPQQTVVKTVTAKVLDGAVTRAVQTVKL
jgi:hypothetical protein